MAKSVFRKERDKFIAFYVSDDEKQIIVDAAASRDMSISDYCRKILIGRDYTLLALSDGEVQRNGF